MIKGDARETRDILLPSSGVTVTVYPSLRLGELGDIDVAKAEAGDIGHVIKMITRMVKKWNAYESEDAEKPLEVTIENVSNVLEAGDVPSLTEAILDFQKSEKKT